MKNGSSLPSGQIAYRAFEYLVLASYVILLSLSLYVEEHNASSQIQVFYNSKFVEKIFF